MLIACCLGGPGFEDGNSKESEGSTCRKMLATCCCCKNTVGVGDGDRANIVKEDASGTTLTSDQLKSTKIGMYSMEASPMDKYAADKNPMDKYAADKSPMSAREQAYFQGESSNQPAFHGESPKPVFRGESSSAPAPPKKINVGRKGSDVGQDAFGLSMLIDNFGEEKEKELEKKLENPDDSMHSVLDALGM